MEYQLKQLGPNDLELMHSLLDCFAEEFNQREFYQSNRPDNLYMRDVLSSDTFIAVVACVGNKVIGGLTAYELKKIEQKRSEIHLYELAVAEPYRRKGIATSLIEKVKLIGQSRGAWLVFVQAEYVDKPAVNLYTKLGRKQEILHFDLPLEK
ncbi:GNAT family N-acetyltransferase [Roseofilum capinflatum]|uniref:GNAT family N-acetyltransferase n=1 Tax=Roseofilum capinflatum BLCC-M114 TaxID=3022440 RepID=A0ABT7B2H9_9CYAN|nr:GNAT family N-acetyltransferase [Roseofilum capinflatum]MDJ1173356.1 GNAT family N-acetyltransferase [Roseofilum capinflatum BLCC-M114]